MSFGQAPVTVGDVVTLGANTLCGSEPEGHITVTTVYLDTDYVVDQVFWQHVGLVRDRLDAQDFAEALYVEPAQILRVGEDRAGMLMPWLDELVALSIDGGFTEHFYRMQALWFSVATVIVPYIATSPVRMSPTQRATTWPASPRLRRFAPLREEARTIAGLLRDEPGRRWTVNGLAEAVHLSPSQVGRVFVDAYGKSPIAYLTMLRAEQMARLLRTTDTPIAVIARRMGWGDPDFAARRGHERRFRVEAVPRQSPDLHKLAQVFLGMAVARAQAGDAPTRANEGCAVPEPDERPEVE
ncbi:DNA-binding domain-containing protein, AraC-type (modular protein) [Nostocoides japonicum T1-X7]|uniref:DNA-binding domain-containing protein, AraC-type (Modular protein) n=1 Tax=Nostocoides japonicum T1-X7 TaxID=1194083 RepID=A0A077LZZ6_9MICO|nr:DNA-binding domain-containing protein, AraC-type (modular protein) [Tetrasphaera japonica T1-X7]